MNFFLTSYSFFKHILLSAFITSATAVLSFCVKLAGRDLRVSLSVWFFWGGLFYLYPMSPLNFSLKKETVSSKYNHLVECKSVNWGIYLLCQIKFHCDSTQSFSKSSIFPSESLCRWCQHWIFCLQIINEVIVAFFICSHF